MPQIFVACGQAVGLRTFAQTVPGARRKSASWGGEGIEIDEGGGVFRFPRGTSIPYDDTIDEEYGVTRSGVRPTWHVHPTAARRVGTYG